MVLYIFCAVTASSLVEREISKLKVIYAIFHEFSGEIFIPLRMNLNGKRKKDFPTGLPSRWIRWKIMSEEKTRRNHDCHCTDCFVTAGIAG